MKRSTLDSMWEAAISFDVETYLIRRGLLAPPLVCSSAGWVDSAFPADPVRGRLFDKPGTDELFAALLADRTRVIVGANIAYDLLVMAVRLSRMGLDAMPDIYAALMDDGRIFDVQHAEALDAVAEGCLGKDPRTGGPLVNPETGRRGRYSLAICVDLVLGRTDAKANDEWRERYAELDDVPQDRWPEAARIYPVDDARNTLQCALAQAGFLERAGAHRWGARTECAWCGMHPRAAYIDGKYVPCTAKRRARNLHDLANQVGTAFAMHTAAGWGFRVNQRSVDVIEADALEGRAEAEEPFVKSGLLKRNRDGTTSRDMSAIAAAVAVAYGADPMYPCATCRGTRKVISSKAKGVKCPVCKGQATQPPCTRCAGEGVVPDPKALINCTDCGATGMDLARAPLIPKTETGRVGTGRDVLNESGDETLMGFADHQEDAKTLNVYVPYLRGARVPADPSVKFNADGEPVDEWGAPLAGDPPGGWRDVPLTLWPNVILETGRTSYGGVIQLFPRKSGRWKPVGDNLKGEWIPSLRECIEARPGWTLSSEDFKAGELYTHAQSCIWIVGHSDLGDALLKDLDPHSALGATVLGVSYEDFIKHKKESRFKNARQAAKPFTFGKPGGMGSVKLVLQQRKQGPDTPCPGGPSMVDDGSGRLVPGFRGLRFCILMDGATACGVEKVTQWGRREEAIVPTCRRCLECADRLGQMWLKQWSENAPYFEYINDCVQNGQLITQDAMDLWPWLRDFFVPGIRLAPGEIMQHVSGRIRGGVDYCSASNGFFQGLLADVAKAALRQVSRECYDRTVRVPTHLHENSAASVFAGGESPLFGSRVIVFQHDEIIAEHPDAIAHEAATRISEVMRDSMRWYCPDVAATCGAEPTLMRRWYKQAEKVVDGNGRLIPWEPKN